MKVLVCHQKVMLQPLGYHCHPTWTSFGKARLTVELVVSIRVVHFCPVLGIENADLAVFGTGPLIMHNNLFAVR